MPLKTAGNVEDLLKWGFDPVIIDAHLHCSGRENDRDVLRALDDAGVDVGVLLAPFLDPPYRYNDRALLQRANQHLASLVSGHEDRLIGLAVINPAGMALL